jgi:hypothetical protein
MGVQNVGYGKRDYWGESVWFEAFAASSEAPPI